MRIRRPWVAGLFAALLLLPVPAFAIQKSVVKARGHVRINQQQSGATTIVQHENAERHQFYAFSRALTRFFRGADNFLKASLRRYLYNVRQELRAHWAEEARTGILSPFQFPPFM